MRCGKYVAHINLSKIYSSCTVEEKVSKLIISINKSLVYNVI